MPSKSVDALVPEPDMLRLVGISNSMSEKYKGRTDAWGKGLQRDDITLGEGIVISGVAVPMYHGKTAELALAEWLNRQFGTTVATVDMEVRRKGDGGSDLCVGTISLQVKVKRPGNRNLVRCRSSYGKEIPLIEGVYVFCANVPGSPDVCLQGWCESGIVAECRQDRAPAGHMNYVVPDRKLNPMLHLPDYLRCATDVLVQVSGE